MNTVDAILNIITKEKEKYISKSLDPKLSKYISDQYNRAAKTLSKLEFLITEELQLSYPKSTTKIELSMAQITQLLLGNKIEYKNKDGSYSTLHLKGGKNGR